MLPEKRASRSIQDAAATILHSHIAAAPRSMHNVACGRPVGRFG